MGLCYSFLSKTSPDTLKDLQKIVCDPNSILDPAKAVEKVIDELADIPPLVEIRSIVNTIVDKVDDIPELVKENLDVSLNKLNREIFGDDTTQS